MTSKESENKKIDELVPTRGMLHHIEEQASQLRERAKIGPLERFDPQARAETLNLVVITPAAITGMTAQQRDRMAEITPRQWSGYGATLPDGRQLILLNPEQSSGRTNVTILEEVAHLHYGHKPTEIVQHSNGLIKRTYDRRSEMEAYWTAAAALLPMKAVGMAVWQHRTASNLAADYGVSIELAEFRIKILGLWSRYKSNFA